MYLLQYYAIIADFITIYISCSLSASHNPDSPWLAVGVRLEKQHKPVEKKVVYVIDWRKPQECCYSFQSGNY